VRGQRARVEVLQEPQDRALSRLARRNLRSRRYRGVMVTLDDVARIALGLPHVTEGEHRGNRQWSVAGKAFAWERPFSKADIRRFGDATPPSGPIVAVRVEDLGEKEAVLSAQARGFFTIPHFDGYAAVLIQLRVVGTRALREALLDGWLSCAPRELAADYIARESRDRR
jgi:hypothetical protein